MAAARGHRVVLFEKTASWGAGCARGRAPARAEYAASSAFLVAQVRQARGGMSGWP